jgi:hypothetical protein
MNMSTFKKRVPLFTVAALLALAPASVAVHASEYEYDSESGDMYASSSGSDSMSETGSSSAGSHKGDGDHAAGSSAEHEHYGEEPYLTLGLEIYVLPYLTGGYYGSI